MEWFTALALPEQIVYGVAFISSLFFVIKTVLMIVGFGDDLDLDMDGVDGADDVPVGLDDISDGLEFFTLHGVMAFFAVGSWAGLFGYSSTGSHWLGLLIGLISGAIMMYACAWIVRALKNLQESGNVNTKKAIGKIGEVYVTIPPVECGTGRVNIVLNGALKEYDAVCLDDKPIEYGERVRVVDLQDSMTMVVQRESEELV